MSHWLVKSEPFKYSWDDLARDGSTFWDGVRNAEARNNLAAMRAGDLALYYHSNEGKEVVGVVRVAREAYPDPTSDDPRWVVVDLEPVAPLAEPVSLAAIKADARLRGIPLVTRSRLSVMPLSREAFERILALGGTRLLSRGAKKAGTKQKGKRATAGSAARGGRSSPGRRRTRSSASRRGP